MASKKQVVANRANAKRSTGPKTNKGKALARMNACKHGLTAGTIVIGNEDPREFDTLRADLEREFKPRPGLERELVERLAVQLWRMRRIPACEASLIEARRANVARTEALSEAEKELSKTRAEKPFSYSFERSIEIEAARRKYELIRAKVRKKFKAQFQGAMTGLALVLDGQEYQDALGKLSRYEATLMNAFTRLCNSCFFCRIDGPEKATRTMTETKLSTSYPRRRTDRCCAAAIGFVS